ncbi:uncharacterized protein LOC117315619 [Pecten maximus]|uniref:uncharacterized protein LOC117315619 n=1 Tax=Pecten maximus TaxID=6579 RepID=UPI001458F857|nr:uncharacterized protein LOC117315619 [Pecten maximus]
MATGKRRFEDSLTGATSTACKKCHDNDDDEIFTSFPVKLIRQIAKHLETLCCESDYVFKTLKILNCNGADYNGGIPFAKAYCSVTPGTRTLYFGSVFVHGIKMLTAFLKNRQVPTDLPRKRLLRKLLFFLSDEGTHLLLKDLEKFHETELMMVLANHLYGKLTSSSKYMIDKNSTKETDHCPCNSESCRLSGQFADTGIGNEEVWHGNLDIIVDNDMVGLSYPSGNKEEILGGNEAKIRHVDLSRNQQIISQTIVFSFLQKQRHPDSNNFLFPCIGAAHEGMVVYFYDSQKDILLESSFIPFMSVEGKVNVHAILASWFAVNYKYLSSGIPCSKSHDDKSAFLSHVKEKLGIYEHNLKFGNLGVPVSFEDDESDLEVEQSDFLSETRWELLELGSMPDGHSEQYCLLDKEM